MHAGVEISDINWSGLVLERDHLQKGKRGRLCFHEGQGCASLTHFPLPSFPAFSNSRDSFFCRLIYNSWMIWLCNTVPGCGWVRPRFVIWIRRCSRLRGCSHRLSSTGSTSSRRRKMQIDLNAVVSNQPLWQIDNFILMDQGHLSQRDIPMQCILNLIYHTKHCYYYLPCTQIQSNLKS